MKNIVKILTLAALTTACANSASHEVVMVNRSSDATMTCSEIKIEKSRLNTIIDGVEQDKKDMTGADVVDGLLWFPFNVIAKQSNYSNAVKAANQRLDYLKSIEREKGC